MEKYNFLLNPDSVFFKKRSPEKSIDLNSHKICNLFSDSEYERLIKVIKFYGLNVYLIKITNYPSAAIRIGISFAPIAANQTIALSFFALPIVCFGVFGPTIKESPSV